MRDSQKLSESHQKLMHTILTSCPFNLNMSIGGKKTAFQNFLHSMNRRILQQYWNAWTNTHTHIPRSSAAKIAQNRYAILLQRIRYDMTGNFVFAQMTNGVKKHINKSVDMHQMKDQYVVDPKTWPLNWNV